VRRVLFLFSVFAAELTLLSFLVDGSRLPGTDDFLPHLLAVWGAGTTRFLVSFVALGVTFTYLRKRAALQGFLDHSAQAPLRISMVALHAALFAGLLAAGLRLYRADAGASAMLTAAFLAFAIAVLVSGFVAALPKAEWRKLPRAVGPMWVYAAGAALAAVAMTAGWRALWQPASLVTYSIVQWMVRPFVGRLIVEPSTMLLATDRFGVIVTPACSGMEGIGLLLLFGGVWLWLYRRECRFPQALLLLPVAMVLLFLLNSARIAALLLIGHAGAKQIAADGFHSQAGWIAFNGVAFGLCIAAGRIPWLAAAREDDPVEDARAGINKVALYIGPMVAILAGGMLARAMTGGFEWMYPLRVVAVCAVFLIYRRAYFAMDWRATWRGPAAGVLVFALWMGLERAMGGWPVASAPAAWLNSGGMARWGWLAFRLAGAVIAVPLAEELAFRGYLIRRLVAEEFDKLPRYRFTTWGLVVSSLLFGAMHGSRWLAGTLAGLVYALIFVRRGRLGEAVVAHAVTNALIAAAVLGLGWWKLW